MSLEELEYSISQYLDGTLKPLEKAALEERLATEPQARAVLEEYRKLDSALKKSLPATPEIAWDRFAAQIHQTLESEEAPVRNYSLRAVTWTARVAIAAAILFVVSIAIHFIPTRQSGQQPHQSAGLASVSGPQVERSSDPVVAEISIGPSANTALNTRLSPDQDIVSRPSVVLIDRATPSGQDVDPNMY